MLDDINLNSDQLMQEKQLIWRSEHRKHRVH